MPRPKRSPAELPRTPSQSKTCPLPRPHQSQLRPRFSRGIAKSRRAFLQISKILGYRTILVPVYKYPCLRAAMTGTSQPRNKPVISPVSPLHQPSVNIQNAICCRNRISVCSTVAKPSRRTASPHRNGAFSGSVIAQHFVAFVSSHSQPPKKVSLQRWRLRELVMQATLRDPLCSLIDPSGSGTYPSWGL